MVIATRTHLRRALASGIAEAKDKTAICASERTEKVVRSTHTGGGSSPSTGSSVSDIVNGRASGDALDPALDFRFAMMCEASRIQRKRLRCVIPPHGLEFAWNSGRISDPCCCPTFPVLTCIDDPTERRLVDAHLVRKLSLSLARLNKMVDDDLGEVEAQPELNLLNRSGMPRNFQAIHRRHLNLTSSIHRCRESVLLGAPTGCPPTRASAPSSHIQTESQTHSCPRGKTR